MGLSLSLPTSSRGDSDTPEPSIVKLPNKAGVLEDYLCYDHGARVELMGTLAECSAWQSALDQCTKNLSEKKESREGLLWGVLFGLAAGVVSGVVISQ